mgnify:CR=1 FL=1
MRLLITGADGFIGKNLISHLAERTDIDIVPFTREHAVDELSVMLQDIDFVFHLAGVNRPEDPGEFKLGNTDLTAILCGAIESTGRKIPVLYTSSIQAEANNPYGVSKRAGEEILTGLSTQQGSPLYIFRLPNVFGKWARPNYNSAVATFCNNISQGLPIQINAPEAQISLVYIDDVIEAFLEVLDGSVTPQGYVDIQPLYQITVGALANQIQAFRDSRDNLISEQVGTGLVRALYSTYVSYLKPEQFSYQIPKFGDPRGVFVEMLKTKDAGQFSYFTAHPGITRGGHYHHSKTEKFLVIKGEACFRFRHIVTGEFYEKVTRGDTPEVVETVTGWSHDITNVGDSEMIVMLWANEIFDRDKPDTYAKLVGTQA